MGSYLRNKRRTSEKIHDILSFDRFFFNMSFCSWSKGEVYRDHFETGTYVCSKCGNELFGSQSKYKHETPWPAFKQTIHDNSLSKRLESKGAYKALMYVVNVSTPCFHLNKSMNIRHPGQPLQIL